MKKQTTRFFLFAGLLVFVLLGFVTTLHTIGTCNISKLVCSEATEREALINDMLPGKPVLLAPFQLTNKAIGKRYYPEDSYVIDDYGMILKGSPNENAEYTGENVQKLRQLCERQGMNFLMVIVPGKPLYDEDITSFGVSCTRNSYADYVKLVLEEQGVSVLDLRDAYRSEFGEDPDRSDLFYKTDHHWNTDAGLMAARLLANELNERFDQNLAVDHIDEDKIGREVYRNAFVGELGMKAMGKYNGRDDFIRRYPLYDTHLRFISPQRNFDETGDFDILCNDELLENLPIDYGTNLYYYYLYGNNCRDEIFNQDVDAGDILLIKDSFCIPVAPFLALTCKHLTLWDMRIDTKITTWIKEHPQTETVVIFYTLSSVGNSTFNDFH